MANSLAENGYDVTILALCYGDVPEVESQGKINVRRLKLKSGVLPSGNKLFGSIKYFEFFFRIIWGYRKADIWHCNDFKPFMVGVIARFFNRKLKLVYDCHELQSETWGISKIEKKLTKYIEDKFAHSARVITVGESIEQIYIERYNLNKSHMEIIYNVPHVEIKVIESHILREAFDIPVGRKIFIYQGGLSRGRGIPLLLETFRGLTNIHAVFMGYGPFENEVINASKAHANIHFQEAVPYEKVLSYTSSADYGMISTENVCLNHFYCMPNKLFEYSHAEIPILVNALEDCRNFVEGNGIGMAVKEETPESWRQAVLELSKIDKSEFTSNLKKVKEIYNWQNEEKKLLEFYNKI